MNTKKILIVDDEAVIRHMISLVLNSSGKKFEITEADSGDEALSILKEREFHLILVDFVMPGMSGIDLINTVKESGITVAAILMSGTFDKEREKDLNEKGFTTISKPFNPGGLQAAVFGSLGLQWESSGQTGAAA